MLESRPTRMSAHHRAQADALGRRHRTLSCRPRGPLEQAAPDPLRGQGRIEKSHLSRRSPSDRALSHLLDPQPLSAKPDDGPTRNANARPARNTSARTGRSANQPMAIIAARRAAESGPSAAIRCQPLITTGAGPAGVHAEPGGHSVALPRPLYASATSHYYGSGARLLRTTSERLEAPYARACFGGKATAPRS